MKNKKWVSKLTYPNERTNAEIEIGSILKKMPRYEDHFVLVERACPIASKSLTEMKEGCDLVKKNKSYVLLYSLYIPSMELYQFLQTNTLVIRVVRCFFKICKSISHLLEHRIIHHDLHFSNMLYSNTSQLLLIDFGLSMNAEKFHKSTYLKEVFTRYMPEWNWYALEIHLLSYLIQNGSFTEKVIRNAIDMYLEKHVVYTLFPLVRIQFKQEAKDYFLPMVDWTREECIEHLLTFWETWDYYETALRFLYLYAEQKMNYPSYLDHLLTMIHANPEKRPNVLQLLTVQKKVIQSFDPTQSNSSYSSIPEVLSASFKDLK